MRVILLQDIEALGKKFDVKDVRDGHARNFLIPRKMAEIATSQALRQLDTRRLVEQRRKEAEEKNYEAVAGRLQSMPLAFTLKMTEAGTAFGSVSAADIHKALAEKRIAIEKGWIELDEPIKTTGERHVKIKFPRGIVGEVAVEIKAA